MKLRRSLLAMCLLFACVSASVVRADDPLSVRIDRLIEGSQNAPVANLASDSEFLRRVTLDLNGTIPSPTEARAFFDDAAPNKRQILVDRLIASPRFAIHLATVFDVMLMERRPDKNVTAVEWNQYLQSSFEKNVPYNQLAREILGADGADPNLHAAAKFYLDRDGEPHLLTRDVGRIFFGMDLQCAQCHDNPLVDHYLQTDYYGLYAFFNRTVLFTDADAKKSFLAEKSDGDANYKSVFTQDAGYIRPQLPGDNEIDEPRFRQGEDYVVAPLPNVRPVPKYSRRAKLAELATNGSNRQFNLNIANRLWALMMGRGLVHPVDLHHPANPPTHPEVLDLIATEFVAMNYNVRSMLRELALTKAYQRSIDPPTTDIATAIETALSELPVVTNDISLLQSIAAESRKQVDDAQKEFKDARTALTTAETAWRTAEAAVATAKKPLDESLAKVAKSQSDADAKQKAISALNEAAQKAADAAKILPKDKEVAAAATTFANKQKELTDELAAVQKSITELVAAQAPLQAKLVESYSPADTAYAAYVESRKPMDVAKAKLIAIWNQHKSDSLAVTVRTKQLDVTQLLLAYKSSQSAVVAARTALESQQSQLAGLNRLVDEQQAQVAVHSKAIAEIDQSAAAARKVLEVAVARLDAKQAVVRTVADAIDKIDAAQKVLNDGTELSQASQKLKERLEPLKKEADTLETEKSQSNASLADIEGRLKTSKQTLADASAELSKRQTDVSKKNDEITQATATLNEAELAVLARREQLVDLWTTGAAVRAIKQLSPEQFGWSTIQATGVLESQRSSADAEIEKTVPKATATSDLAKAHMREVKVEQQLNEQMRGVVAPFVRLYASSAGQPQDDFFATPDQALFVTNGGGMIGWVSGGQLAAKLAATNDPRLFAEELYLATLTRRPTESEIAETTKFIESRSAERPQAIRDLIWSLVTSAEFRFNH